MSSPDKLRVLITGCSPGGMGAALAIAFHKAGHHVFATARNLAKLSPLSEQGIETISLDVTSKTSITSAVASVTSSLPDHQGLDILINNAAGSYTMPIVDVSLEAAKNLFDVNVWSQIAVTQAFMPLLLMSSSLSTQTMIVNHTSVGSVTAMPFQGIYNSSKAALAMLTETMRLELAPFNIRVVELKTAGVKTNIVSNSNVNTSGDSLPMSSIYAPARDIVQKSMAQEGLIDTGISPEQWAAEVSALLLSKNPPNVIWKGESALLARVASLLPRSLSEGTIKKMTRLDVVDAIIKEKRK
jgi:1-acylglycerone phosphate reductase